MPGRRISPELSEELRVAATPIFKAKGAILFRAGQPGRGAFVVRSGQVKMILDGAANFYPTRILGSGALIGLPAAVSGEPYSLTAEATKDCRLDYSIPTEGPCPKQITALAGSHTGNPHKLKTQTVRIANLNCRD